MRTVFHRDDTEGGHIVYNARCATSPRHYSFQPKACRPYRAKTKGKVERPYRYVREDFFLGGSFRNLEDLNLQFEPGWTVANPRTHATTGRVVAEHFAEELPHLQALPAGPFQAVLQLERRITRDGMISLHGNLYSVPDMRPAAGSSRSTVTRQRGPHPRGRAPDRRPPCAGGPRPPPHRRRTSQPAAARQQQHAPRTAAASRRAGETVTPRRSHSTTPCPTAGHHGGTP